MQIETFIRVAEKADIMINQNLILKDVMYIYEFDFRSQAYNGFILFGVF